MANSSRATGQGLLDSLRQQRETVPEVAPFNPQTSYQNYTGQQSPFQEHQGFNQGFQAIPEWMQDYLRSKSKDGNVDISSAYNFYKSDLGNLYNQYSAADLGNPFFQQRGMDFNESFLKGTPTEFNGWNNQDSMSAMYNPLSGQQYGGAYSNVPNYYNGRQPGVAPPPQYLG